MKRWQILLWVFALGLLVGPLDVGCSSKKKEQEEKEKARGVSLINVRVICRGCVKYAYAHEGKIPNGLEELKSFLGGGILLESPRQPEDFDGPGYIYVKALGGKKFTKLESFPHEYVIVYENPAFCEDYINVGFLDGHEEKMTLDAFRQALEDTYKKLGVPMPEGGS
ncbi:MAG: hypothetical protein ACYS6W_15420 [Planctomycetota bacterium]|jgi:hypothetical protein